MFFSTRFSIMLFMTPYRECFFFFLINTSKPIIVVSMFFSLVAPIKNNPGSLRALGSDA